jgi:PilZ domain
LRCAKPRTFSNRIVTSLAENFPVQAEVHVVDEHRIAPRRRLLKAGKISFGGGAAIDCTIRNLSETGAALEVISPVGIPERFTLVIEADDIHVPCRVVWRKEKRIGVHFET